jgi:hypothetical protein
MKADPERLLAEALRAQAVNSGTHVALSARHRQPTREHLSARLILIIAGVLGLVTGVVAAGVSLL